jgi:hypothetical protein
VETEWKPILALHTEPLIQNKEIWEKVPEMDARFNPVLAKID